MKRNHEPGQAHDDGSLRELIVILLYVLEVVARRVPLANCPRGDLVPALHNMDVQLGRAGVSSLAQSWRKCDPDYQTSEINELVDRFIDIGHYDRVPRFEDEYSCNTRQLPLSSTKT